jgi:putative membrane protein (TIGR04086 family)
MGTSMSQLRWGRIVIGAVLTEVALIALVVPVQMLAGDAAIVYIVAPACFIATFVFGLWVARKANANFALHGALVGVLASMIYIALTWNQTLPLIFHLSHLAKILGGAAGGAFAARRLKVASSTVASSPRT